MKKIIKILLIIFGFLILIFSVYVYKLHSLTIEGNKIFEYRCTNVNPPLISYKISFLKMAEIMNNNPNPTKDNDFITYYDGYISGIKKYIPEENKWLDMQKAFSNRWDYKLIEPWYIKQGDIYEIQMYQDYRDNAQSIIDLQNIPDPKNNQKLIDENTNNGIKIKNKLIDDSQIYFEYYAKIIDLTDWRKIFSRIPPSKICNESNLIIPDTTGSVNLNGTPTPPPKVIHGLEDLSS